MRPIEGWIDRVDHHQYFLSADIEGRYPMYSQDGNYRGRLLSLADNANAVCLETGIAMGTIWLTLEMLDSPPARIDTTSPWEVVEELTFEAATATATILYLMDAPTPAFTRIPLPAGASPHSVRAHARGRALDYDAVIWHPDEPTRPGDAGPPREHHLIQVWPSTTHGVEARASAPDRGVTQTLFRTSGDDPWAEG